MDNCRVLSAGIIVFILCVIEFVALVGVMLLAVFGALDPVHVTCLSHLFAAIFTANYTAKCETSYEETNCFNDC